MARSPDQLGIGVDVLLADRRTVLRHQHAVPGPALAEQREHLAAEPFERVFRDRASRVGVAEHERLDYDRGTVVHVVEAGHALAGGGQLGPDLLPAEDLGRLEGGDVGGLRRERVRLVREAQRRQSDRRVRHPVPLSLPRWEVVSYSETIF
jgi:hypothetical protein